MSASSEQSERCRRLGVTEDRTRSAFWRTIMYILGNLLLALAQVINLITTLYTFIVAGSVIVSWVHADPNNPIVHFLYSATEPVYSKIRKIMPPFLYRKGIDWTPLMVIIILMFFETLVGGSLGDLGSRLRR